MKIIFSRNPYIRKCLEITKGHDTDYDLDRISIDNKLFLTYLFGQNYFSNIKKQRSTNYLSCNGRGSSVISFDVSDGFKVESVEFMRNLYSHPLGLYYREYSTDKKAIISPMKVKRIKTLFESTLMEVYREELTLLLELYDNTSKLGDTKELKRIKDKILNIFNQTLSEVVEFVNTCFLANESTAVDNIESLSNELLKVQDVSYDKLKSSTIRRKNNNISKLLNGDV